MTQRLSSRAGGLLVAAVLTGLGPLLGLLWESMAPARPSALVVGTHRFWGLFDVATLYPWEETENWMAGDGRFAMIMVVVGLVAGVVSWYLPLRRGIGVLIGLAAGGVLGSILAGLVGFLVGGGDVNGAKGEQITTALWVHSYALYFVQAMLAVLVYTLFIAFTERDDLNRRGEGPRAEEPVAVSA